MVNSWHYRTKLSECRLLSVLTSPNSPNNLHNCKHQGPVVQNPINTNPGLTLNKTCGVNPGFGLIGLWLLKRCRLCKIYNIQHLTIGRQTHTHENFIHFGKLNKYETACTIDEIDYRWEFGITIDSNPLKKKMITNNEVKPFSLS